MTDWRTLLLDDPDAFNAAIDGVAVTDRTMFVGADLTDVDLSGARLDALDLTDADLSGSTLPGYWLSTCRLERTRLDSIVLDDDDWLAPIAEIQALWAGGSAWTEARSQPATMILNQAHFARARFDGIDLSDITFPSGELTGAGFVGAHLDRTQFRGARLDAASFSDLECRGLSIEQAHASDSSWTGATIRDARFNDAELRECTFIRCQFENVNFNDSDLRGSRFDTCVLVDCLFFDTDVTSTTFTGCDLVNTSLEHAVGHVL